MMYIHTNTILYAHINTFAARIYIDQICWRKGNEVSVVDGRLVRKSLCRRIWLLKKIKDYTFYMY